MIVLDASAVLDLLLGRPPSARIAELLAGHEAYSLELLVPEVLHALRRFERRGELTTARAAEAVADLTDLPVELCPLRPLISPIWDHRAALTAYDTGYVSLASALGATLVTTERRLARTASRSCAVARL